MKITNLRRMSFNKDFLSKSIVSPMTVKKTEDGKFTASIDNQPDITVTDTLEATAIRKCNDMLRDKFIKGEVAV